MARHDEPDGENHDGRDDEDRQRGTPHPGRLNIRNNIMAAGYLDFTLAIGKWQLSVQLTVELVLESVEVVVEVVGLISHIGRAGRTDINQQQAIPNFIF